MKLFELGYITVWILSCLLLASVMTGCVDNGEDRGSQGQIPENTAASINFTNEGEIIVLNEKGEALPSEKVQDEGELVAGFNIKFIEVNPCYIEIASYTGGASRRYLVSPNACPPGLEGGITE